MGTGTDQVAVALGLPPDVRCLGETVHDLGAMPMGAEKMIEWTVQADAASIGAAEIRVTVAGRPPVTARHPLVFFASEDSLPGTRSRSRETSVVSAEDRILTNSVTGKSEPTDRLAHPRSEEHDAVTYYVDSATGGNANAGTSPAAAWKDFTNVNGRTLKPGERLLIRRGSVLHQELTISARGTADRWSEIGSYGTGPRPVIRRNWDIADRCALVQNLDFLRIRSLVVCYAGKGLIANYTEAGHQGLVIEDCIAHHIEGLYRPNSHGIPEWRDGQGAAGDGLSSSAGIAFTGATAKRTRRMPTRTPLPARNVLAPMFAAMNHARFRSDNST